MLRYDRGYHYNNAGSHLRYTERLRGLYIGINRRRGRHMEQQQHVCSYCGDVDRYRYRGSCRYHHNILYITMRYGNNNVYSYHERYGSYGERCEPYLGNTGRLRNGKRQRL
jgi:hypothetical protein